LGGVKNGVHDHTKDGNEGKDFHRMPKGIILMLAAIAGSIHCPAPAARLIATLEGVIE
jgi:hypothetical protein